MGIILKPFIFDLRIKNRTKFPRMQMVKGDVKSNQLLISIKDSIDGRKFEPVSLVGATVFLVFLKADDTRVVGEVTIKDESNGLVEYIVQGNEIAFVGEVTAEVQVYGLDSRYTTSQFTFTVVDSLDNDASIASTTEYPILVSLINSISSFPGAEALRVTAEQNRATTEVSRVDAETLRESTTEVIKTAYDNATRANLSVEVSNARGTFSTLQAREDSTTAHIIVDTGNIKHSLATVIDDFLVASGVGIFVKKTLAEVKAILGLGSAAYTASTDFATSAQGVLAANAIPTSQKGVAGGVALFDTVLGLSNKIVVQATRATNLVGAQTITLGFRPRFVRIHAFLGIASSSNYDSDGSFDGTSQFSIAKWGNGTSPSTLQGMIIFLHSGSGGNYASIVLTPTDVTLTWTAEGAALPTGNIIMKIEAF